MTINTNPFVRFGIEIGDADSFILWYVPKPC